MENALEGRRGRLRSLWPLLLLLLLLLLVKSAFVLALSDVFFYCEELEKGTAAKAMLDRLAVPHHQLAYHYYEGGGFVVSHIKALAFLLVGQNLLAHKLVALAFDAAILAAGWAFARGLFGARAALWFGLLFVFAPESFQKLGLISVGIHFEAGLFLIGVLALGARILFARDERRRTWAALGLVTGFGLYFSYQVAVAALWVGLLLLLLRPRAVFGPGGLCGLAGAAVGAAPLVVMLALVGGRVLDIHGIPLAGRASGPSSWALLRDFFHSIYVEGLLGDRVAPWAWLAAFGGACALFFVGRDPARRPRRLAAAYVLGYLALFALAYTQSGFVQGRAWHFYLVLRTAPLWLLATLFVAAALGGLAQAERGAVRRLGLVAGCALVALGARASWFVLETGRPARLAQNWHLLTHTKGYSYDQYFAKVLPHFEGGPERKLQLVEGFDEDARGLLRADVAGNLFRDPAPDLAAAVARARAAFRAAGGERAADYELGLGPLLVVGHGWDQARAVAAAAATPPPLRDTLLEALGRFGGGFHPLDGELTESKKPARILRAEVERGLALERPDAFLRGVGRFLYRRFRIDPVGAQAFIESQPEPARAALRAGYGAEEAWHTLP